MISEMNRAFFICPNSSFCHLYRLIFSVFLAWSEKVLVMDLNIVILCNCNLKAHWR